MKRLYLLITAVVVLAASAAAAPGLKVTGKGVQPSNNKLFASSDNRISGLVQSLTLTNTGDVALNPGDEGYTLTLFSYGVSTDCQTYTPEVALAPGEEKTIEVHWDFDFTPLDAAYEEKGKYGTDGKAWDTFRVRENVTGSESGYIGPWMDVFPYRVSFNLVPENSGTELDAPINFGFVSAPATKKYRIRATGAADVTVTSIEVPSGFTVAPATPFTVKGMLTSSSDNFQTIEITADPTIATGVLSGDMIITAEGADAPKSYKLQAVAMAEDDFYENFETVGKPKGWVVGKYWDRYELSTQLKGDGNRYGYQHSRSGSGDATMLITPRLSFAEGGKMQFDAARISSYSSDTRVKVYWSADRGDWTLLKTVDTKGADGAEQLPVMGKWGTYTLDNIPSGDGYIAFEGLYIYIDNVYGGQLAKVDYDVMITSFQAPKTGKVNDPVAVTLTLDNMLADKGIDADAYTMQLFADGRLVASAPAPAIDADAKGIEYSMSYTPHTAGVVELKGVFTLGSYVVASSAKVDVAAETSTELKTVGTVADPPSYSETSANIPLKTNYRNSESQSIYTEEFLSKYGIVPGTRIDGIMYEAYCTDNLKEGEIVQGTFTVAFKTVEEYSPDKSNPYVLTDAETVASKNMIYDIHNSGKNNYYPFIDLNFAKPYVYNGGNLMISMKSETPDKSLYKSTTYKKDTSVKNASIYRFKDDTKSFATSTYSEETTGIPVVNFKLYHEPATASGKVTDSEGNPVKDVTVSYVSGDVMYSSLTGEDGTYSMEIYRPALEYTVTADNENYPVATAEGTVRFEDGNLSVTKDIVLGEFTAERAFDVTFKVTNDAGQSMEGIPFSLRSNNFSLSYSDAETVLGADGTATVKCFGGSHTITLSAPGMKTLTATFGINKSQTREFNLKEDVKAPYGLEANLLHDVNTGVNDIALSWNNEVPAFSDDFEGYTPFAIEFSPWTGIDGDGAAPAQLSGKYDHSGELNYGQIINPYAVEPMWDLNNYWTLAARSGRQYLGFVVRNDGKPLDDMVITPAITIGEDFTLRFYAKASDKVNARFTVGVTEKLDNPAMSDFRTISDDNYIDCSFEEWTPVQISLAEYAGKDVKIGIRCISEKGSFVSMIDDVFVGRLAPVAAKPMRSAGNPNESFVISLDGEDVGVTSGYDYMLEDVPYGNHTIGVRAKYVASESEMATVNVNISESDYVKASVTLKTNNGVSPEGMSVAVEAVSPGNASAVVYSTDADAEGKAVFKSLPKNLYRVKISAKDFNPWQQIIDFQSDKDINAYLFETLYKPFNLTVDAEEQADGSFNALAKWNQNLGFADGFESYSDFATGSFGGWITKDLNEPTAYSYPIKFGNSIVIFPGCSTVQNPACVPPMVFNPAATSPSMTEDVAVKAPEGEKTVIFQGPQAASADKWLISPAIEVRDDYELSVLAKSYPTYPETLEFLVNEEGTDDVADFRIIDTVSPSYEEWTQYTMNVGQYAGKNVRFAIHCISRDGFIALVDDFKVGRKGGEDVAAVGLVKDYLVKVDGQTVGTAPEASYALAGLKEGKHTLGVMARYESGYSEMAELPFNLVSGVDGIAGESAVSVRAIDGAILVEAPEGAAVTVSNAGGILIADTVSDGSAMRIAAATGVYAVKVGSSVYKVIVR